MPKLLQRDGERPSLHGLGAGLLALSLIVWSGAAGAANAPESFSALAKKVTPAVVNIASVHEVERPATPFPDLPFQFPEGSPFEKFFKQFRDQDGRKGPVGRMTALGSGFIVDPSGYVVTNNHVIDDASDIQVRLEDDSVYPAKVIGSDPQTDLALLKIESEKPLPSVSFGDSDKSEVGDWVMAVGNPFGLGGTVTAGIISARGRNIDAGPYDDFLQIDAPINQGNSGGPLFNLAGEVVGINTAIYTPNGGSVGIGFAIPANMAKTVIAQLREDGKVERGWLGVNIQSVTPDLAAALGLSEARGAIVAEVMPDSPAAEAGIRQGDVILSYNGEKVSDSRDLARTVAGSRAGEKAPISVWRGRKEVELSVLTGKQPADMRVGSRSGGSDRQGAVHSDALKAELASLTPELRAQFGLDDDAKGVLVLDVAGDTPGASSLHPGDLIKEVDQTAVSSPRDVEAAIEKAKKRSDNVVLMLISRSGQELFLGVQIGLA